MCIKVHALRYNISYNSKRYLSNRIQYLSFIEHEDKTKGIDKEKAWKEAKKAKDKKKNEHKNASSKMITRLEFKVGRILSVKNHPGADSLFIEEIDLGEEEPRQVIKTKNVFSFFGTVSRDKRFLVKCLHPTCRGHALKCALPNLGACPKYSICVFLVQGIKI